MYDREMYEALELRQRIKYPTTPRYSDRSSPISIPKSAVNKIEDHHNAVLTQNGYFHPQFLPLPPHYDEEKMSDDTDTDTDTSSDFNVIDESPTLVFNDDDTDNPYDELNIYGSYGNSHNSHNSSNTSSTRLNR